MKTFFAKLRLTGKREQQNDREKPGSGEEWKLTCSRQEDTKS
jgi:hypothetical protein